MTLLVALAVGGDTAWGSSTVRGFSADPPVCQAKHLMLAGGWAHAAATLSGTFSVRNTEAAACTLLPPASIEVLTSASGTALPVKIHNRFDPIEEPVLAPGQAATIPFGWFDSYCGPRPTDNIVALRFTSMGARG